METDDAGDGALLGGGGAGTGTGWMTTSYLPSEDFSVRSGDGVLLGGEGGVAAAISAADSGSMSLIT
jgi:hypothetical protein